MYLRQTPTLLKVLMILSLVSLLANCRRTVPAPAEEQTTAKSSSVPTTKSDAAGPAVSSNAPAASPGSASAAVASSAAQVNSEKQPAPTKVGDPLQGKFSLSEATQGLKTKGRLWAEIVTDKGQLRCELFEDKTPNTVANFVGLARGLRPFKDPEIIRVG